MRYPVILLCSVSILFLGSCSKDLMSLTVTRPAPVVLPDYVERVAVLDRSLPTEKNEPLDVLDRVLSAEGKNFDREGAQQALNGLEDQLSRNERFTEVKLLDDVKLRSAGFGVFPAPLSWEAVQKICDDYKVDALYTLAFYDTDTQAQYETNPVELKGPLGVRVPAIEHTARVATQIKSGWRIYDPSARIIADEYILNDQVVSVGRGVNPMKAVEAVLGRKEAVMQTSNNLGAVYAERILPYRLRVSRYYFVGGTRNLKIAKRRAQAGNWDGAAELWSIETNSRRRKIAGRASHNMAIINEINGDLPMAIEWASKAYTDYRIRDSLRYLRILRGRLADEVALDARNN